MGVYIVPDEAVNDFSLFNSYLMSNYNSIDKENRKKELLDGLDKCISNIFDHPAMIMRKAEQSLERIAKEHDPNVYAEKLKYLYRRVL